MATERLLSPSSSRPDEDQHNWALRPATLNEYVGQGELLQRLRIAVQAARDRGEPVEHILLHGPPGLGKTSLAHVIAAEMGSRLFATSGPALTRGTDLIATLTQLASGDVLFVDEIHRLPVAVEEFIYPAMEDFRIDVRVDAGAHARTVQVRCKPFSLVGATTRAGLLSSPLRSRFGVAHHLRYYSTEELRLIVARSVGLLKMDAEGDALAIIASRSRGTPRIANRLLRRVRDYAQVRSRGRVSPRVVEEALALEGVDALGLDEFDRSYLRTIATTYDGGPVGLDAVAATMNEDAGTIEDMVEPFLLQIGFLARTRRGRMLTRAGAEHVGMEPPETSPLFDE